MNVCMRLCVREMVTVLSGSDALAALTVIREHVSGFRGVQIDIYIWNVLEKKSKNPFKLNFGVY